MNKIWVSCCPKIGVHFSANSQENIGIAIFMREFRCIGRNIIAYNRRFMLSIFVLGVICYGESL